MSKKTEIPTQSRMLVMGRARAKCERCGMHAPNGHWHHRRSRSVHDDLTHTATNGVHLCVSCHTWVHAHPFEARRDGFIVSRYSDPSQEPFLHSSLGWVFIHENGNYASHPQ